MLKSLFEKISRITGQISIQYNPPQWMKSNKITKWLKSQKSFEKIKNYLSSSKKTYHSYKEKIITFKNKNNRRFWILTASPFIATLIILVMFYYLNKKSNIKWTKVDIKIPDLSSIVENKIIPQPLKIKFNSSVAKLNQLNKRVSKGIRLKPEKMGYWKWTSDKQITFYPKKEWSPDEEYKIHIDKKLLSTHVNLKEYEYKFKTKSFRTTISNFSFYINPKNPSVKQITATIDFSHPVNPKNIKKYLELYKESAEKSFLSSNKDPINFTMTFASLNRTMYIKSQSLAIPQKTTAAYLEINDLKSIFGGSPIKKPIKKTVSIPGLYDYMKITDVKVDVIRNKDYRYDQIIFINTTGNIYPKEIGNNINAYLLPVDRPAQPGIQKVKNYEWHNKAEIGPKVIQQSKKLKLNVIPSDKDFSNETNIRFKAQPGRFIFISINKGIHFIGGYKSGKKYEAIYRVPDYPKDIKILHNGAILSLSGEHKISVMSNNISTVRFEVGRILPDQINHLLSQTRGEFKSPLFTNEQFGIRDISKQYNEVRHLKQLEEGSLQYFSFDFSKYLKNNPNKRLKNGLFYFRVKEWKNTKKSQNTPMGLPNPSEMSHNNAPPPQGDKMSPYDEGIQGEEVSDFRIILVTDMGVLVKDNSDKTHDIYVQSFYSGKPVGEARVSVIGRNGLPIVNVNTDQTGHARIPSLKDFKLEEEPVVYIVTHGDDLSFLPYNKKDRQINFTRFDIGGVRGLTNPGHLRAFLFSDRKLYRPGDAFHVGIIIKAKDWTKKLADIPLEITITDSRGLEIHKEKKILTASGFEEFSYKTEDTAPTGNYSVNTYIIKDKKRHTLIGSTIIHIEEFLPDRLKIITQFSKKTTGGWVSPKELEALITLNNLFGAPAKGHKVSGKIDLYPSDIYFQRYKDYQFVDPYLAKKHFTDTLKDLNTDDKGNGSFKLNLDRFDKATFQLTFFAEGFEKDGGRAVSISNSILVSSLPYLVGYKPDDNLKYITRDSSRSIHLIGVNSDLIKIPIPNLTAELIEVKYVSALIKQKNGTYEYQSIPKKIPIHKESINISSSGLTYPMNTEKPGNYILVIKDRSNTKYCEIPYNVVGEADTTLSLEKNAELQITLNKKDYEQGEKIELQIKSPYTGSGLITIEREKVYMHKWFQTNSTSSIQTIEIPDDLEGGAYLNIAFIRAMDSKEIYINPLSYGVVPFSINLTKKNNPITIDTPEIAQPGKPLKIRYSTAQPGKIVVFAIDEGILQVSRYKTPDPLTYFFKKQALEVNTRQIVDLLLPEYSIVKEVSSVGGDQSSALNKNLNPFKKKHHKPVAYWSGIINSDNTPKELIYNVPDYFNGTLRVMAVTCSNSSMGSAEKKSFIRDHFVIRPNIPNFVAPNDEFELSVSVYNTIKGSGKNTQVQFKATATPNLKIIGNTTQTLTIPENGEVSISYKVKASQEPGIAKFTFSAHFKDYHSKLSEEMSIRPAVPYIIQVKSGYVRKDKIDIPIQRKMFSQFRTLNTTASYLPLALSKGLMQYLDNFPYGCTEQIISRSFPYLTLKKNKETGIIQAQFDNKYHDTIRVLRVRQNAEGAFGFWTANSYVSTFQTVYVLHYLTEAKENGYTVPDYLMNKGIEYLKSFINKETSDIDEIRNQAYGIYILTRNAVITTPYINTLRKRLDSRDDNWKNDLTAIYLSGAYKIMKQNSEARSLIKSFQYNKTTINTNSSYYSGDIRNVQYLYIISRHFPDQVKRLPGNVLISIVDSITKEKFNTISSAYTILALNSYKKIATQKEEDTYQISQLIESGLQKLTLKGELFPQASFSHQATAIHVHNTSDLNLFYQITQAGFDISVPVTPVKNGIEVFREYLDSKGNVTKIVRIGDMIKVRIRMRSIDKKTHHNNVIIDLLPGGFEVVDNKPGQSKYTAGSWTPDFIDMRDDRTLLFGKISENVSEYQYMIRAVNKGKYIIPPVYAKSMYNRDIHATTPGGNIEVTSR